MKDSQPIKAYYFFDEAGDTQILARKGVNLLEKGTASKTFMVGYLETTNHKEFSKAIRELHEKLKVDEYLASIPSMSSTNKAFHANKDCAEVRQAFFKLLKDQNFKFYCIVARKNEDLYRKKFDMKPVNIYKYLVSQLLKDRLHLYSEIDCYFSSMGNIVRQDTMQEAINGAIALFKTKWNKENDSTIRVFIQQNSEMPLLQAADYVLWTVQRAYERGDFRYYNFMKDKISLVHDVFDAEKYPNTYYTPNNPLEAKKIDPV
ncbi:MAG: DUF3800 domain-containing protein [Paludibacteraceae bacterium]|nr:DUF3800 domain-containing protein [Paludibacteraceae bacterium]